MEKEATVHYTYPAQRNTDLEEIGVVWVVLLTDLARIPPKHFANKLQILRGFHHELTRLALGDLDVLLENIVILEANLERCNCHGLGNSTKVEYTLLTKTGKVVKAVVSSG